MNIEELKEIRVKDILNGELVEEPLVSKTHLQDIFKDEVRELETIASKCVTPKDREYSPIICPIFMSVEEREKHIEKNDDPETDACIDCHIEWGIGKLKSILGSPKSASKGKQA